MRRLLMLVGMAAIGAVVARFVGQDLVRYARISRM